MRTNIALAFALAGVTLSGCEPAAQGIDLLGNGTHDIADFTTDIIADESDGLFTPRDLEVNPLSPDQLWIVNRTDNSTSILFDFAEKSDPESRHDQGAAVSQHFLAQPSALAFGDNGLFATIHETDERTQGTGPNSTPADFMGPTTWTSDLDIYDGGHSGHMDMLHNSPNGMGIAWEKDSVYWVFDGYHASLTRYDFGDDHGPGGSDHSDGKLLRYVEGEVAAFVNVPGHVAFDPDSGLVYVADTGNQRIAVLDPSVGSKGDVITRNYDNGAEQNMWDGGELTTLVDGNALDDAWSDETVGVLMQRPSGIELYDDPEEGRILIVSDNGTGMVLAFTLDGKVLDFVKVQADADGLMGLEIHQDVLYYTDAEAHTVSRTSVTAQ